MKTAYFIVSALIFIPMISISQEFTTPEALRAFGKPGDTVKISGGKTEKKIGVPPKKKQTKSLSAEKEEVIMLTNNDLSPEPAGRGTMGTYADREREQDNIRYRELTAILGGPGAIIMGSKKDSAQTELRALQKKMELDNERAAAERSPQQYQQLKQRRENREIMEKLNKIERNTW